MYYRMAVGPAGESSRATIERAIKYFHKTLALTRHVFFQIIDWSPNTEQTRLIVDLTCLGTLTVNQTVEVHRQ